MPARVGGIWLVCSTSCIIAHQTLAAASAGNLARSLGLNTNLVSLVPVKPKQPDTNLRVIKKLAANARGAKALTAEYGDKLLCVRHRIDATGAKRLVTVELVVSEKLIARRPGPTVDVAIKVQEKAIQAKLKAAGARWDATEQVWMIRRSIAIALGLKNRIVPRAP